MPFNLSRPSEPLPTGVDFDPWDGCLDAQCALKNFGGMSLDQAYELFMSCPEIHQEDFMFMGWVAFAYYLPVIDRYLREFTIEDEWGDNEAGILGHAVKAQFGWNGVKFSKNVLQEIEDLSAFVQASPSRYAISQQEQERIVKIWQKADRALEKYRAGKRR